MPVSRYGEAVWALRARNTVLLGAARFVITIIRPARSTTNKRLVSPGGEEIVTGCTNLRSPKASAKLYPGNAGARGNCKVVVEVRSSAGELNALWKMNSKEIHVPS